MMSMAESDPPGWPEPALFRTFSANCEYLSADEFVQRSEWSDGTSIAVNFSDATYDDGEIVLPPRGFLVEDSPALGSVRGSIQEKVDIDR